MCYLCDQDRILATYGVNAAQLAAKIHYQDATTYFIPDGVGGDLRMPQYNALLVVTADTVPDDITTTTTLTVDAPSVVSTIDTIGDQDFYRVELVEGQIYDFGMYAKVGGPSATPLSDSYIEVYDADGNLITSGDGGADTPLNAVNSGFDVLLTFVATESGTYYINARGFDNVPEDGTNGDLVGDYEIFVQDVTDEPRYIPYYEADSPLYALDWGTQVNKVHQSVRNPDGNEGTRDTGNLPAVTDPGAASGHPGKNVISIYFARAGDVFVSNDPTNPGLPPATITATGVQEFEHTAVMTALGEFSKVADIVYVEVADRNLADFVYTSYIGTPGPGVSLLGSMSPPDESDEGLAQFNSGDERWNALNLQQGGFSFVTLIHEFGHGHGLAHPHDNGGRSGVMNGVVADGPVADYTTGDFALNQAVFTMMSYQDGWQESPYGNAPTDVGYGYLGGLMAFDIAAIQDKYGVNEEWATGNDTYRLKDVNAAGTYYSSIWDGGGRDRIVYSGARDAVINLRPATLRYESGGGGFISYAYGIFGGFTVANGVTIEDAKGGAGNDALIGNDAKNTLEGGNGDDVLEGGLRADTLIGGFGKDTASYAMTAEGVKVDLSITVAQKTFGAGVDTLTGIENLTGSAFADVLAGDALGNRLDGGAGDDVLSGGANGDVLVGGAGIDRLLGGVGADTFLFRAGDTGATAATADTIADFDRIDTIDLSAIDAVAATTDVDDAFVLIGTAAFSNTAGELRITRIGDRFVVEGDTDGDGVANFMIVGAGVTPAAGDFAL